MAYITKLPVSENLTKLMESLGFGQVDTISPQIAWSNMSVMVYHLKDEEPKNLKEAIKMIFKNGIIEGENRMYKEMVTNITQLIVDKITPTRFAPLGKQPTY